MFNFLQFNTTQFNGESSIGSKSTNKRRKPRLFLSQRKTLPRILQTKNRLASRIAP